MNTFLNILTLLIGFTAVGQTKLDGQYVGYERISPYLDMDGDIRYYKFDNKNSEDWYHRVTITIQDTLVTIEKVPIYFKKGNMNMSLSDGEFYFYHGTLTKTDSGWTTLVFMDSCRNCHQKYQEFLPLRNHLDTAYKIQEYISKYTTSEGRVIFNPLEALTRSYFLKLVNKGLIGDTYLQHKILFKLKN